MVEALRTVYVLESQSVSGFHGGRPALSPWSYDDVLASNPNLTEDCLLELIDVLREQGHLMTFPKTEESPSLHHADERNGAVPRNDA